MAVRPLDSPGVRLLRRNRDFRRFLAGQFVTNAGDSLYTVAVVWTVHDLTGSAAVTGAVNAVLLLPWLLQILAGPLIDRLPVGPVLVGTQVVQGAVVLTLPLAAATGRTSVGLLAATALAVTLGTVLLSPVPAVVVPRIVDDDRLSDANSALATVTLGLDVVFDAVGGVAVAVVGAATLFFVDAATFAVAAALFAGITIPPAADSDDGEASGETDSGSVGAEYVADLRDGVDVLRGTVFVDLVALTAAVNLATGVTLATLPAFADGLAGSAVYGLLLGALGTGRLVGSLAAPRLERLPYGRVTVVSYGLATVCWLGAATVDSPAVAVVLFGLAWIPPGIDGVFTSTLNQRVFPDRVLGRVSSVKGAAAGATLPLGSLLGGVVAGAVGPTTTVALAAGGVAVVAVGFLVRPRLRRLPAVAEASPEDFDVEP